LRVVKSSNYWPLVLITVVLFQKKHYIYLLLVKLSKWEREREKEKEGKKRRVKNTRKKERKKEGKKVDRCNHEKLRTPNQPSDYAHVADDLKMTVAQERRLDFHCPRKTKRPRLAPAGRLSVPFYSLTVGFLIIIIIIIISHKHI
jgi:hypothetical protein